jgi:ferric-dicitrate binding protein FerR (iron transport regulator)
MSPLDPDEDRDEALRALAPMREGPVAVAGRPHEEAALRARVLEALRANVEAAPSLARARKRRQVIASVAGGSCLLAAAAAAVMMVWPREHASSPMIGTAPAAQLPSVRVEAIDLAQEGEGVAPEWIDALGQRHPLSADAAGWALPSGTLELRSNDAVPRLRTAQGVELKLAKKARLRVLSQRAEEGAELRLLDGEVACAVPKLGATRQFAIDAPGVRVIVHGTRFTVRAKGSKTCVRVTEGLVAVHPEASDGEVKRIGPGEQWGCEHEKPEQRAQTKPRVRARAAVEAPEPQPTGTLDAENRLLAEALRAERKQDRARAHRLFEELLEKHPSSPLATDAAKGLSRTRE